MVDQHPVCVRYSISLTSPTLQYIRLEGEVLATWLAPARLTPAQRNSAHHSSSLFLLQGTLSSEKLQ